MAAQSKTCQWSGCACAPVPTEKFCRTHRVAFLRKIEREGYLEPLPDRSSRRRRSEREDTDETKFGVDQ